MSDEKCPQCGWGMNDVNELTKEIERLTAELAECSAIGNRLVDQKMAIVAERDRLLEHGNLRQMREIDRLRAALERIIDPTVNCVDACWLEDMRLIAREALAVK